MLGKIMKICSSLIHAHQAQVEQPKLEKAIKIQKVVGVAMSHSKDKIIPGQITQMSTHKKSQ